MHRMWSFLLAVVMAVLAFPALASQVSVSPVRVDLSKKNPIVALRVYNQGDEEVVMESSMRIWNQSATGQWLLSPTSDIQAFPGLVRIQAKSSAVVRVGLSPSASFRPNGQGTYRLFLRELASPKVGKEANVRMVLNINLPVFVEEATGTAQTAASNTVLSATVQTGGVVNFVYNNPAQASTLSPQDAVYTWLDASGKPVATTKGQIEAYALPGGVGRWNQPLPGDCKKISTVQVKGDLGVSLTVPLTCPR